MSSTPPPSSSTSPTSRLNAGASVFNPQPSAAASAPTEPSTPTGESGTDSSGARQEAADDANTGGDGATIAADTAPTTASTITPTPLSTTTPRAPTSPTSPAAPTQTETPAPTASGNSAALRAGATDTAATTTTTSSRSSWADDEDDVDSGGGSKDSANKTGGGTRVGTHDATDCGADASQNQNAHVTSASEGALAPPSGTVPDSGSGSGAGGAGAAPVRDAARSGAPAAVGEQRKPGDTAEHKSSAGSERGTQLRDESVSEAKTLSDSLSKLATTTPGPAKVDGDAATGTEQNGSGTNRGRERKGAVHGATTGKSQAGDADKASGSGNSGGGAGTGTDDRASGATDANVGTAAADGGDDDDADDPLPSSLAGRGLDEADRTAEVSVLQDDPNTPYYSATSFEELGLSVELLQGVYASKFNKPSKVQAVSLPMILGAPPKNLIAQAHNGSGKTACFVLGMLSRIDFARNQVQALCVVPTRELARQIRDVIMTLGKYTNVRVYCAVKQGEEEKRAGRVTNLTDHVVVGTPGRVMDLLRHRVFNAKAIKTLVLDEADEMIDTQGMGDQTLRIKKVLPGDVHTLLFSATYPEHVREFALKVVPAPNQITVKREQLSLDRVKQFYIECGADARRFEVLSDIYGSLKIGQSIIFVERRRDAAELAVRMRNEGHSVSLLHGGDMTPEERDRVIDEFRGGTTKVLIATNVLARGVDVLATTIVINYDLPKVIGSGAADPETYLHRVGRTGRFGRKGVAVNFVYDDASRRVLKQIEDAFAPRGKIEKVQDVEALETILEDRTNF